MKECPNCGVEVEEESLFCQNCGSKIETVQQREVPIVNNSYSNFEYQKNSLMIVLGYLTLFIQFVAVIAARYHLRVINADRIILYPILCVMLSFYMSSKLAQNEKTYKHAIIISLISVLLFIIGII